MPLCATAWEIAASKPDLGAKEKKQMQHFLQGILKGKSLAPRLRKPAGKSLSTASSPTQPPCNIHATITMRSAARDSTSAYNYTHMSNHTLQNTKGEPKKIKTIAAAPATHTRYLSSPPAATLHGKAQGFVLRLPPQPPCNIHAAITMRFTFSQLCVGTP